MTSAYENYLKNIRRNTDKSAIYGKYKQKTNYIKQLIREYVHENAALVDELEEVQVQILIKKEERKFLLKKLCEFEPHVAAEVQNFAKKSNPQSVIVTSPDAKTPKRKHSDSHRSSSHKKSKSRRSTKTRKHIVAPIPIDGNGKPIFPIELGRITIHSLGDVNGRPEFHTADVVYPVGYVSTRKYGSLKDPMIRCVYTCKIYESNDMPRFEIASDDGSPPIIADTPDACHSLLLQRINDSLSLNVVSTRPKGNEFFGLSHPSVLNLIQGLPGTRKCINYRWNRFEVMKNGEPYNEGNDAGLSFEYLQRSINYCKYKMAPDVLQKPEELEIFEDNVLHDY